MQQRTGLTGWIRNYLICGALWCLIVNVHAVVTGATSPLVAASGPSTGMAKAMEVAQVLAHEIGVWPFEIWERVVRPTFG